jgi:F-type H+-transporting ATPase subunit gamma
MASTEELVAKIRTTEDLGSVVRTMKTLAMVNIRQYLQAADSLDDYYRTVELGLRIMIQEAGVEVVRVNSEGENIGAVIFGSDQGLSGRFNDEIIDHSLEQLDDICRDRNRRFFISIGDRLNSLVQGRGLKTDESLSVPRSVGAITQAVSDLLVRIERWREEKDLGRVILFYNRQKGKSSYSPSSACLLPFPVKSVRTFEEKKWPSRTTPIITMEPTQLFRSFARQYFFVTLFRAFALSLASENASRLASMQAAEKNIDERLEDLTSQFRSQRQTAITQELLETVAGFEALAGHELKG